MKGNGPPYPWGFRIHIFQFRLKCKNIYKYIFYFFLLCFFFVGEKTRLHFQIVSLSVLFLFWDLSRGDSLNLHSCREPTSFITMIIIWMCIKLYSLFTAVIWMFVIAEKNNWMIIKRLFSDIYLISKCLNLWGESMIAKLSRTRKLHSSWACCSI